MIEHRRRDESQDVVVHFRPRRRRAPKEIATLTLNLAPMIDVVFLLLIFFIVTTTFKRAEGVLPANLPKQGVAASTVALPVAPIIIHLSETGTGATDYAIRVENIVDLPKSFNELTGFLRKLHENPGFDIDTPVVIKTGREVRWDFVVGCWNGAVRAGCRHVSFGLE